MSLIRGFAKHCLVCRILDVRYAKSGADPQADSRRNIRRCFSVAERAKLRGSDVRGTTVVVVNIFGYTLRKVVTGELLLELDCYQRSQRIVQRSKPEPDGDFSWFESSSDNPLLQRYRNTLLLIECAGRCLSDVVEQRAKLMVGTLC